MPVNDSPYDCPILTRVPFVQVGTYNAGPAFAAVGTEDAKMPLLQSKY